MKVSIFCASLLVLFAGCVSNALPTEESEEEEVGTFKDPKFGGNGDPIESMIGQCVAFTTHTTVVDGVTYTVQLPVECNMEPAFDTGDPPLEDNWGQEKINPSDIVNELIDA